MHGGRYHVFEVAAHLSHGFDYAGGRLGGRLLGICADGRRADDGAFDSLLARLVHTAAALG